MILLVLLAILILIIALMALMVLGRAAKRLDEAHKLSLLQAIWVRKANIEKLFSQIQESPQFSMQVYFKIGRAEAPEGEKESSAMGEICRKYIDYFYALELAKRDFASLPDNPVLASFIAYCEEKQGNINVFLQRCLMHKDLCKYVFQGPFLDDDILHRSLHEYRREFLKSERNHKTLEQAHA